MELIVDDFCAFIGKKNQRFQVHRQDNLEEFPIDAIEQIIVVSAASISTEAIKAAMENQIDIVFVDWRGDPVGRIYPCRLGGTTLIRKKQAEAYGSKLGADFAKAMIESKILNQAYFIRSLGKTRDNEIFEQTTKYLLASIEPIHNLTGSVDDIRLELLGIEGSTSNKYFECLKSILPFEKRERFGKDKVNPLLNYGYGILYSEIERACILSGLDPYLGFLHTDRYNKPSLVLDFIEGFRPVIVDRAVVTLFAQKKMSDDDYEPAEDSLRLTKIGRKKILEAVLQRLTTAIDYNDKQTPFKDIILRKTRDFAKILCDSESAFQPFIYRW